MPWFEWDLSHGCGSDAKYHPAVEQETNGVSSVCSGRCRQFGAELAHATSHCNMTECCNILLCGSVSSVWSIALLVELESLKCDRSSAFVVFLVGSREKKVKREMTVRIKTQLIMTHQEYRMNAYLSSKRRSARLWPASNTSQARRQPEFIRRNYSLSL